MPFPSAMCIMKESYTSTVFWLAIRWMLSASVIRHPSVLLSRMTYRCYSLFLFNIRKEVSDDAQKWQERLVPFLPRLLLWGSEPRQKPSSGSLSIILSASSSSSPDKVHELGALVALGSGMAVGMDFLKLFIFIIVLVLGFHKTY